MEITEHHEAAGEVDGTERSVSTPKPGVTAGQGLGGGDGIQLPDEGLRVYLWIPVMQLQVTIQPS